MRVGLVLGAGGIQGGAWLTGGLYALATEKRWDPADAHRIVGTSAGAMIGALVSAGTPLWFMVAHSAGEDIPGLTDARGEPASAADRNSGAVFRPARALPPVGPGSPKLAVRTLLRPHRYPPAAVLAGWAPRGVLSTEPLKDTVRRAVPSGWSPHPGMRVVACDYETGRRVVFGRDDAPPAELADAVAASCAIPGFYHPVTIAGRRYADGGIWSTSNLDVVRTEDLDLVICFNPTSILHPTSAWNPLSLLGKAFRDHSGRRLGSERKKVRATGTEVILIQPTAEDLEVMGGNLMSRRNRHRTLETAIRTVRRQLREPAIAEALAALPECARPEKIERPPGPPSSWPALSIEDLRPDPARAQRTVA